MPAAASPELAENYLRFAAKIGVITDADVERELPIFRGKETKEIGRTLVDKGILHPNNFKLLESMFARQLSRTGQPTQSTAVTPTPRPPEPREPPPAAKESHGFGLVKGDTSKLKGSAQATTRYKFVRPLTTTGLSELFVAEDVELHREVVFKRLHAKHQRSPGHRIRFNRSAEVASGLEHPCIPPIYNHGLDADGRPYYTTRYLTGESFAESVVRLHAADPADPPQAIDAKSPLDALRKFIQRLLQVCNALSYAHSRGVLHCGLSPERILLGRHGETLVVGWGRAELIYGRRPKSSQAGAPTPAMDRDKEPGSSRPPLGAARAEFESPHAFTSPEQLTGDPSAAGILSDVYSLGALLFFTVTGKPPFSAPSDDLSACIAEGLNPADLLGVEKVSPALARICDRAMSLDSTKRQVTVRAFAADLEQWLHDDAVSLSKAAPPQVPKSSITLDRKQLALIAGAACLLSALLGAWIAGLGSRSRPTAPRPTTAVGADAVATTTPNVETQNQWIADVAAAATAAPATFDFAVETAVKASKLLLHPNPDRAVSLLDDAESALARRDDDLAARKLKDAEPFVASQFDPASAELARWRWAAAVGALADRSHSKPAAVQLLQDALAACDRRLRAENDSWSESKQSLTERLCRLYAWDGRFREALRASDDLKSRLDSTVGESTIRFLVERAEWLGFEDRHTDAVAEFGRIADFLSASESSSARSAAQSLLRFRAQLGLAEELLALDQSPAQAINDARKSWSSLKTDVAEAKALRARLEGIVGAWLFKSGKATEAEIALKAATTAWSKATSARDVGAAELIWSASAWDSLRQAAGAQKKEDALAAAERAVALLESVPDKKSAAERLNAVDTSRGVLLVQLGKLNEAETAYSRVLVRGGSAAVNALYFRGACRLELKNFHGARNDAEQLGRQPEGAARYLAARVFSRLAEITEGRTKTAVREDGDRAISLLKYLSEHRFFTDDRADLPTNDAELEAVRQRADFKALFAAKPASTEKANPTSERSPSSP